MAEEQDEHIQDDDLPDSGEPPFYWTFPEYETHHHTRRWWMLFWGISALFILISLLSKNFLFAIIILMFDILIVYRHHTPPVELECIITEQDGIFVGERAIPFKTVKSFWIAENPDSPHRLYLALQRGIRSHVSIPVPNEIDPRILKAYLAERIPEDPEQEHELIGDTLAKILKI